MNNHIYTLRSIAFLIFTSVFATVNGQSIFSFEMQDLGMVEKYGTEYQSGIIMFIINGEMFQIDNDEGRVIDKFTLSNTNKLAGCRFYDEKENEITMVAEYDEQYNIIITEILYNKYSDKTTSDVVRFIKKSEFAGLINNNTPSKSNINNVEEAVSEGEEVATENAIFKSNILGTWNIQVANVDFPKNIEIIANQGDPNVYDIYFIKPGEKLLEKQGTLKDVGEAYISTNNRTGKYQFVIVPMEDEIIFNNIVYETAKEVKSSGFEGMYFTATQSIYIKVAKTLSGKYNIAVAKKDDIGEYKKIFSLNEYNILDNQVVYFDDYDERHVLKFIDDKIRYGNYTLKKQ